MPIRAANRAEAARLKAAFEAAGAVAGRGAGSVARRGQLLDLYGEDIRARAYVTSDALRGEQMLRPDFTLPVVQMHMDHGAEPARYTYAGEVFRRQEDDAARANEYLQVGYEIFQRDDPAAAEAEVFARIQRGAGGAAASGRRPVISVVLTAAVAGLGHHRAAQGGAAAPYLAAAPVSRPDRAVFGPRAGAAQPCRAAGGGLIRMAGCRAP